MTHRDPYPFHRAANKPAAPAKPAGPVDYFGFNARMQSATAKRA